MSRNDRFPSLQARINGCYRTQEAAEKIGISVSRLLYWKRLRIVRPQYAWHGRKKLCGYSEEDIKNATLVKLFMDTGRYTLKRAIHKLKELG